MFFYQVQGEVVEKQEVTKVNEYHDDYVFGKELINETEYDAICAEMNDHAGEKHFDKHVLMVA